MPIKVINFSKVKPNVINALKFWGKKFRKN